jgi:vacuolar protein sorting-associated protein VTA1
MRPGAELQSLGLKVFPSSPPDDSKEEALDECSLSLEKAEEEQKPSASTKAQEHCRSAMSALEFADAETAKAEIRAAIALLGGCV